ncbi:alpha/beta hydrolase [Paenibacillus pabuli]|uniref:alpha/beta fold hydrolase n=1 Tax=Paenibacillus pabuli TaxID=1472 RepID=UPI0032427C8B
MTVQVTKEVVHLGIGNYPADYKLNYTGDLALATTAYIIVHGAMGNSETTNGLAQQLAQNYENQPVFQLDLVNHGTSSSEIYESDIDSYAGYVTEFVTTLRDQRVIGDDVVLIGHSMGGSVVSTAVLNGLNVSRLVLVSTRPDFTDFGAFLGTPVEQVPVLFEQLMTAEFSTGLTEEQSQYFISQIPAMSVQPLAGKYDIFALSNFNIRDKLHQINVPLTLITGDSDTTVPLESALEYSRGVSGFAEEFIIEGGTHTAVIKNSELVASYI